ncbi:MAG: ribosome silencing factor [Candidatus Melainabacteria bacterium]|nr:ribosome silencing factor [Candidatus Melainabacteria bacterium]
MTVSQPSSLLPSPLEVATLAANVAEAKQAGDTQILEIGHVSCLADYFVVCSGDSAPQLRAIFDSVTEALKAAGITILGQERDQSGRWFLVDCGDVIVHVMHSQERAYYQLERFWSHATQLSKNTWLQQAS